MTPLMLLVAIAAAGVASGGAIRARVRRRRRAAATSVRAVDAGHTATLRQPAAHRHAIRLATLGTRWLPEPDRARYTEEYTAELIDLRHLTATGQLRHALRLHLRSPLLGRELRRQGPPAIVDEQRTGEHHGADA